MLLRKKSYDHGKAVQTDIFFNNKGNIGFSLYFMNIGIHCQIQTTKKLHMYSCLFINSKPIE